MPLWTELASGEFSLGYIKAGSVRTRVLSAGKSGAPLIFLHGTGGHLEAFVKNILPHAEKFRVFAIDMVGHGYSDKPDRPYEMKDYVHHLLQVCDALQIERAHISGESLGGWVAASFAINHPSRVNKLILNTAGGLTADPAVMDRIYTLSINAVRSANRDSVRKRLEFLMHDPRHVSDDLVEMRYGIYTQPGFERTMENILCLQKMDIRKRNMLNEDDLKKIPAPTLVVWTDHDPTAPVSVGERFATLIPNARLEVMKNCGHWPQFEDPETFNRLQLEFLGG
ncbi:MAG: alpha/beta hydrolase [Candidatus Binataceae bacterium]|nr:alpha/beta hydrolase [Candidatus Binataceae bacterium]